jgi:hypothetical protein
MTVLTRAIGEESVPAAIQGQGYSLVWEEDFADD